MVTIDFFDNLKALDRYKEYLEKHKKIKNLSIEELISYIVLLEKTGFRKMAHNILGSLRKRKNIDKALLSDLYYYTNDIDEAINIMTSSYVSHSDAALLGKFYFHAGKPKLAKEALEYALEGELEKKDYDKAKKRLNELNFFLQTGIKMSKRYNFHKDEELKKGSIFVSSSVYKGTYRNENLIYISWKDIGDYVLAFPIRMFNISKAYYLRRTDYPNLDNNFTTVPRLIAVPKDKIDVLLCRVNERDKERLFRDTYERAIFYYDFDISDDFMKEFVEEEKSKYDIKIGDIICAIVKNKAKSLYLKYSSDRYVELAHHGSYTILDDEKDESDIFPYKKIFISENDRNRLLKEMFERKGNAITKVDN